MKRARTAQGSKFSFNEAIETKPGPELKYFDDQVGINFDTTGSVGVINALGTGTDNNARIGRRINLTSVGWNLFIDASGATAPDVVRFMIVYDKQTNGALASIGDIVQQPTAAVNSFMDMSNQDRFLVLHDERFEVSPNAASPWAIRKSNGVVALGLETTYSSTGATIVGISTGALLILAMGNFVTASGYSGTLTTRVRFTDD